MRNVHLLHITQRTRKTNLWCKSTRVQGAQLAGGHSGKRTSGVAWPGRLSRAVSAATSQSSTTLSACCSHGRGGGLGLRPGAGTAGVPPRPPGAGTSALLGGALCAARPAAPDVNAVPDAGRDDRLDMGLGEAAFDVPEKPRQQRQNF